MQIGNQTADQRQLLIVFFAEYRHIGPQDIEQLGDHRGHTGKMPGPAAAAEMAGKVLHADLGLKAGRIHLLRFRGKDRCHRFLPQQAHVALKIAGVAVQILVGAKLGGVDKHTDHHRIAMLRRQAHQAEVAFMQIAHGRHQADGGALAAPGPGPLAHGLRLLHNLHHWARNSSIWLEIICRLGSASACSPAVAVSSRNCLYMARASSFLPWAS